jgi:ADP-ribose pyrophosphatase YjhB (NUDIX family)
VTDDHTGRKVRLHRLTQRLVTRGFQSYWRLSRGLTFGAQGLIIDADDRILLIRHTYRPGWHFPGGGVERNETVETALARELDEEAAVKITGPPSLFGIYANFKAFPSDHVSLFVIRDFARRPFSATREIAAAEFFARDALPEGTIGPVHRRLAEVLDGARPSPHW